MRSFAVPQKIPTNFTRQKFPTLTRAATPQKVTVKAPGPTRRDYSAPSVVAKSASYHASRDYQMQYAREQQMSRRLAAENRRLKSEITQAKKSHAANVKSINQKLMEYEGSGVYMATEAMENMSRQYAKATNMITPSVNGIQGFPQIGEGTSRVLATVAIGIFVLSIIGRVK